MEVIDLQVSDRSLRGSAAAECKQGQGDGDGTWGRPKAGVGAPVHEALGDRSKFGGGFFGEMRIPKQQRRRFGVIFLVVERG